jgi:hypothetical protein
MLCQPTLRRKLLINLTHRTFKIKMKLNNNNINITKNPLYTKVDILKGGDINLKNKTFIFGKIFLK